MSPGGRPRKCLIGSIHRCADRRAGALARGSAMHLDCLFPFCNVAENSLMGGRPLTSADVLATLYTAVLSDVMDELGYPNQAMRPFVRPLDESLSFLGRARTGLYASTYSVLDGENPYELEIRLVDDLKPGDVAVFACGGPTDSIAPWGELLTTAAMARERPAA